MLCHDSSCSGNSDLSSWRTEGGLEQHVALSCGRRDADPRAGLLCISPLSSLWCDFLPRPQLRAAGFHHFFSWRCVFASCGLFKAFTEPPRGIPGSWGQGGEIAYHTQDLQLARTGLSLTQGYCYISTEMRWRGCISPASWWMKGARHESVGRRILSIKPT